MGRYIDITGGKFGRWNALRRAPSRGCVTYWWCRCDCGTERAVESSSLREGTSSGCGCHVGPRKVGAGEYRSYRAMLWRCTHAGRYADVPLCERWRGTDGYENFLNDMGPRPDNTTLDRIDNALGYEPRNCRWSSSTVQSFNRRNTRVVNLDGVDVPLSRAVKAMRSATRTGGAAVYVKLLPRKVAQHLATDLFGR